MTENKQRGPNLLEIGQPLPAWQLETIMGDTVPSVEQFRGKPLLILIFNLGCPGCIGRAIPFANSNMVEHGEKIQVIGIHTNFEGVDFDKAHFEKAKEELYIRFPFYRDVNYNNTFLKYGAGGTPHWVIADKDGLTAYSIFGSEPNNALLRIGYVINGLLEKNNN